MKKYLWEIRWYLFLSVVANISETLAMSFLLFLPGYLIDTYNDGLDKSITLIMIYVISFFVYLLSAYFSNRMADYRRIKFEKCIKTDYFNSIIEKDNESFHSISNAEYISRQANDITELCQNYLSPMMAVIRSVIMILIFGLSLVVYVDKMVAVIIFIFSLLILYVPEFTADELSKRNAEFLNDTGIYTKKIQSYFEAKDILDKNAIENVEKQHLSDLSKVLESNMFFRNLNSFSMVLNGGAAEFVEIPAFISIAFLLITGRISTGMATVGFMYCHKFIDPIYELNLNIGKVKSTRKVQDKILSEMKMNGKAFTEQSAVQIEEIKIKELSKDFEQISLHYPNCTFEYPKKYLIVGENGTGKSILMKVIMGYLKPTSGSVEFVPIVLNPAEHIVYVPQSNVIFEGTYEENISIFGTYSCDNIQKYEAVFPVIVEQIKNSKDLKLLSGGEKQILGLIRALCSEKSIMILDEPFSAMNINAIESFMQFMKNDERMMIIIAHNLNEYYKYFDKVYKLKRN